MSKDNETVSCVHKIYFKRSHAFYSFDMFFAHRPAWLIALMLNIHSRLQGDRRFLEESRTFYLIYMCVY